MNKTHALPLSLSHSNCIYIYVFFGRQNDHKVYASDPPTYNQSPHAPCLSPSGNNYGITELQFDEAARMGTGHGTTMF